MPGHATAAACSTASAFGTAFTTCCLCMHMQRACYGCCCILAGCTAASAVNSCHTCWSNAQPAVSASPACTPQHLLLSQILSAYHKLPYACTYYPHFARLICLQAAAVPRLQQYDFQDAPASRHTSHSPDTPHAQPPQQHLHHHHGSASYTNISSDPNQQHHSSSGMEDCPASSAAAAGGGGGGYDLNLSSSQLAAAHQYMMSQAAAAGGDGYVPGSASGMQHMAMSMAAGAARGRQYIMLGSTHGGQYMADDCMGRHCMRRAMTMHIVCNIRCLQQAFYCVVAQQSSHMADWCAACRTSHNSFFLRCC